VGGNYFTLQATLQNGHHKSTWLIGTSVMRSIRAGSAFKKAFFFLVLLTGSATSETWNPTMEKQALQTALQQDKDCNQACAISLAGVIIDQGIEQALDLVASLRKIERADDSKEKADSIKVQIALFYAMIGRASLRGEKIISTHGACSNKCDQLNSDVVALARSGALGPMLHDGKVDPAIFQDQRIFQIYLKYVTPIPSNKLPWQFHNEDWWKKIASTA
jgi:hypothetical protein